MKSIQAEQRSKAEFAMTKFWKRKDVMVVAAGSIPCIRELYILAEEMDTLHQFRYVKVNHQEYILGSAEGKIRQAIRDAAAVDGVQVVVFYLSCLDILIRIDFKDLETSLSEETGKWVRCFYRGPLGKEERDRLEADAFMATFPTEEGTIVRHLGQLPPLMSDGAGISDWIRRKNHGNVLVTPAGCRSCMSDLDMTEDQSQVYYPQTETKDFVFGMEETTCRQTCELLQETSLQSISLIGTAVPSFMGMDGEALADELQQKKCEAWYLEADGFHDALYGVSQAELAWAKRMATKMEKMVSPCVQILGGSPLLGGLREDYQEGIDFLQSLGYTVLFDGETALDGRRPALNWVVSSAGLAAGHWLKEEIGIPLLISRPVGAHAWQTWKRQVQELLKAGEGERALCIHNMGLPKRHRERILFIGDPVQIMGEAHALWHEGYYHLQLASLVWTKETKELYKAAPGSERFQYIASLADIQQAAKDCDVVCCDPWLFPFFSTQKKISYPWGVLSGRKALRKEIFGKRSVEGYFDIVKSNA